MGLHSSDSRALQRERRGHGFESRWSPGNGLFFPAISQLRKLWFNCEGHIFISLYIVLQLKHKIHILSPPCNIYKNIFIRTLRLRFDQKFKKMYGRNCKNILRLSQILQCSYIWKKSVSSIHFPLLVFHFYPFIFSVTPISIFLSWFVSYSRSFSCYSQLSPCGHLAITDTPLIRTAAKSPAKVTDDWLKQTPAITDPR